MPDQPNSEDWRERFGRAGFLAKGVLYGIVGIIAIGVAIGSGGDAKGQSGALSTLADSSAGKFLLVLLAIGLGGYALYRLIEVFVGVPGEDGAEEWAERGASVVRTIVYGGLCFTAIQILSNSGGGGGSNPSTITRKILEQPAGQILVGIAGVVLIGTAGYQAYKAYSQSFMEELKTGQMSATERTWAERSGIGGYAARAVIYTLTGGFLVKAAIESDASETKGLDGALQEIAQQSYGPILLGIVAAGLFIYGFYCLFEARYRQF